MTSLEFIMAEGNGPFFVAVLLTLFIALIEVIGLIFGLGLSGMIDDLLPDIDLEADVEIDATLEGGLDADIAADIASAEPNYFVQGFSWLNAGRVPFLVLLLCLLASFGAIGLLLQSFAGQLWGLLPWYLATPPALAVSLPVTRWSTALLGKVMPQTETYIVSQEDFVGSLAVVTIGPVDSRTAGRARVTDANGNFHNVRIRAAKPEARFDVGSEVLLVAKGRRLFRVIKAPDSLGG